MVSHNGATVDLYRPYAPNTAALSPGNVTLEETVRNHGVTHTALKTTAIVAGGIIADDTIQKGEITALTAAYASAIFCGRVTLYQTVKNPGRAGKTINSPTVAFGGDVAANYAVLDDRAATGLAIDGPAFVGVSTGQGKTVDDGTFVLIALEDKGPMVLGWATLAIDHGGRYNHSIRRIRTAYSNGFAMKIQIAIARPLINTRPDDNRIGLVRVVEGRLDSNESSNFVATHDDSSCPARQHGCKQNENKNCLLKSTGFFMLFDTTIDNESFFST
jgi:hypothetical protein